MNTIIKRDGKEVSFDESKIFNAIYAANKAVDGEKMTSIDYTYLTKKVVEQLEGDTCTVEQVQDIVEQMLIKYDWEKTAKAYILYRAEHAKIREAESDLMNIYNELTYSYSKDADIKRENANIDGDTSMGTMLKYGSEGAKYFVDNYVLPKDIAKAHINGDIHIHDKDFYMLTETCCQIDLIKLFKDGFCTGHGYLREPQSIMSYASLACIAIQANQNEMHGGQSVPNFDYSMASGVARTYIKEFFSALTEIIAARLDCEYSVAKDLADKIKAEAAAPTLATNGRYGEELSKWFDEHGEGTGFTKEQLVRCGEQAAEAAWARTDKMTYQAMEALIHNLNTMNSRAGAQVPFSSVNFGTDTSPEGRMVIKNFLLATEAGLGNGETPIFPVSIFKVKEGVNFNEGDPNYDLFKLAVRCSAKRLFPNFSFLDAPFNKKFYKEGDYNTEVAYMGCRTRVMANNYDPTKAVVCGRGNLSFTSINLPRIGIESNRDFDLFYKKLDEYLARLDLCKGRYVIRPLNKLADKLAEDMASMADLIDDDVLWDMSKRALVSAWKAGCILWALNGQTWTRSMGEVVEWLLYRDIWSKLRIFSDMLKGGDDSIQEASKAGPKNMLNSLPNTFNEAQLEALRLESGKSKEGTKNQLKQWVFRKFITYSNQTGMYTKTEEYLKQ